MINQVYRLIAPRLIRADLCELQTKQDDLIVRPQLLSICAADQRYFQGSRPADVLERKLPMALIHEAIGTVLKDPTGTYAPGTPVVMIPNIAGHASTIKPNYRKDSTFRSSGTDGFMQSYVALGKESLLSVAGIRPEAAVLLELLSVAVNALDDWWETDLSNRTIGIWGTGSLGYLVSYLVKQRWPLARVLIFGRTPRKLAYFSFVDAQYRIGSVPEALSVDIAFECVGGTQSQNALAQIVDRISPQGQIHLLGVSEDPVDINTRLVLEKGLSLYGHSRSDRKDFQRAIDFLKEKPQRQVVISRLVDAEIDVRNVDDMMRAFKEDTGNDFKTVMVWHV